MNTKLTFSILATMTGLAVPAGAEPDFVKEIKPLLETRCLECHGPSKMEGELDLSYRDGALIGGELGPAIVEGDAKESLIVQRILLPSDDEEAMPSKGKRLTKKEVEKIRAWIVAGAPWPDDLTLEEVKVADPPEKAAETEPPAQ